MTSRISVEAPLSHSELSHMSEVALEFAQVAQDSGLTLLANIFRMAALEASDVRPDVSRQVSGLLRETTTH